MMLIRSFIATFAAGIILAASGLAFAQTRTTTALKTGYAPVNGLNLYYEIHGTGEPLILLHGGLAATEMFGEVMPATQRHVARILNLSDPSSVAFGPNTHGFVLRLLSLLPPWLASPAKV